MKHYAYLLIIAIALIGCEKNGINYDIVAGHTYVNDLEHDTIVFNSNNTFSINSVDNVITHEYTQDYNLIYTYYYNSETGKMNGQRVFEAFHNKIVPLSGWYAGQIYEKVK